MFKNWSSIVLLEIKHSSVFKGIRMCTTIGRHHNSQYYLVMYDSFLYYYYHSLALKLLQKSYNYVCKGIVATASFARKRTLKFKTPTNGIIDIYIYLLITYHCPGVKQTPSRGKLVDAES